jgi:hypothetical protein
MKTTINPYVQDLYGREVDGWYWVLLEEGFSDCAIRYRARGQERAASIADRLAESADDVPAQLMRNFKICGTTMEMANQRRNRTMMT